MLCPPPHVHTRKEDLPPDLELEPLPLPEPDQQHDPGASPATTSHMPTDPSGQSPTHTSGLPLVLTPAVVPPSSEDKPAGVPPIPPPAVAPASTSMPEYHSYLLLSRGGTSTLVLETGDELQEAGGQ